MSSLPGKSRILVSILVAFIAGCADSGEASANREAVQPDIEFSTQPIAEMSFRMIYNNHTNNIVADGIITDKTPEVFQDFLDANPFDGYNFVIELNSPGGSLLGGMVLGRMIREHGLSTGVVAYSNDVAGPGECMSACALAFLGGEDKELLDDSILGFHQFSSSLDSEGRVEKVVDTQRDTQMVSSLVHDYIVSMGVSSKLFSMMSSTSPEKMYVPDEYALQEFNIIPLKAFRNFTLEPFFGGVGAKAIYVQNAKGLSVVSQVIAFCRNSVPYLLLSAPEDFGGLGAQWVREWSHTGFDIYIDNSGRSLRYPSSNLTFFADGAEFALLEIDESGVSALRSKVEISGETPSVSGRLIRLTIDPTDKDVMTISSAFKHCID